MNKNFKKLTAFNEKVEKRCNSPKKLNGRLSRPLFTFCLLLQFQ